jgi:hypothetical protein
MVGLNELLLMVLLRRQPVRQHHLFKTVALLEEEVRHVLIRRIMLEIHQVELPFLDRMILFVICIRVDQDLTLLTLHPGEPLLVIQYQDAVVMRRLKEFVLALLLHLHR